MPKYTFGSVTITAPDRRAAVEQYNAMMAPQNQAVAESYGYESPGHLIYNVPPPEPDPGPSPGGDYGGWGAAPARPPYDVNADPAYQAFVAALDAQRAQSEQSMWKRMGEVKDQANTQVPRIAEQGVLERGRINTSLGSRGMFRSGERLNTIGLQQRGENQRIGDVRSAEARSIQQLSDAYQQQAAEIARQRAERALELTAANAY